LQGRLLREYRAEKDNILRELAYHQRIADLEQQRAHLHDGEPCPLCGATEHPYASELPAQPDDLTTRLEALDTHIKQAETLNEQHENAQRALASAREKQQQTENTLALAAEKARNSAVHAEQHAALQQTYAQTLAARQALLANRDPDAEETAQQHAIAEAEAAMEKARDTYQTAQTAAAANQQQRAQLHARLTAQQQELQTAEQQFAAALGMCSEIAAPSPAGRSPQRGRDGEGVDDVPCAPKISTFSISDHPHSNTSSRAATTFPDETAWQAARLPAAAREALARQAAALDQQTLTLHTRQQDRAARLASLTAQSTDDPDTATLQARQEADEHTRQQHQQTLAANQHRLAEHKRASERLAAQQQAIAKQAAETRRWQNLHELIGAADGKKYRNYAQSLTFASVIAQANRQLAQLNDRYLLAADPALQAKLPPASVLTPHPGEFARLAGRKLTHDSERITAARDLAARLHAVVVLKGKYSIISAPNGDTLINPTGNAGLAKGGSGDVLAGIIAALLAQGYPPFTAAALGTWLHGLAADIALTHSHLTSLTASDLIAAIPAALQNTFPAPPIS
ncbi:MAG: NAD(P)H-hydrate dehydratase, partial [Cardiobacterium hominis]